MAGSLLLTRNNDFIGKEGFQGLKVWQKNKQLATQVYKITDNGIFRTNCRLKDIIRRSSVSTPSIIAESDERDTDKEAMRHLYIAKGSAIELLTRLIIAYKINYLNEVASKKLEEKFLKIPGMLSKLISVCSKTFNR